MYRQLGIVAQNSYKIIVTNLKSGDSLCYSLALIKGRIQGNITQERLNNNVPDAIRVCHRNGDGTGVEAEWPVVRSQFKCLVNLRKGTNEIVLKYGDVQHECVLEFKPRRTTYRVMPVYIICGGHHGRFQAPAGEDDSVRSACRRIAVGAKLIQCLAAEKLSEAGFTRGAFQLESDLNSQAAECTIFHSRLHVEAARKMAPGDLWECFGRELMSSSLGSADRKFLAFLSCTRYLACAQKPASHEGALGQLEGQVALGGGGLAIFGTACLHTWPQDVGEVLPRFSDTTLVDGRRFMDDSCYRGTYGGCFATTLGSVCHELGHAFDLGHTETGIMGRGFDDVDRVFTLRAKRNDDEHLEKVTCRRNVGRANTTDVRHATVQFTKVLNLSYSISDCTKPRSRRSADGKVATLSQTAGHEASLTTDKLGTCDLESDMTYWGASCATLLAFHRWFTSEVPQNASAKISFDELRGAVASDAGLCVVELRDDAGLVLESWQFSQASRTVTFDVPAASLRRPVALLLAEDCAGNILKKHVGAEA